MDAAEYLPTPDEIREACERIRADWTERERRERAGLPADPPPIELPRVRRSEWRTAPGE